MQPVARIRISTPMSQIASLGIRPVTSSKTLLRQYEVSYSFNCTSIMHLWFCILYHIKLSKLLYIFTFDFHFMLSSSTLISLCLPLTINKVLYYFFTSLIRNWYQQGLVIFFHNQLDAGSLLVKFWKIIFFFLLFFCHDRMKSTILERGSMPE